LRLAPAGSLGELGLADAHHRGRTGEHLAH
jgi:hypothetical protein